MQEFVSWPVNGNKFSKKHIVKDGYSLACGRFISAWPFVKWKSEAESDVCEPCLFQVTGKGWRKVPHF